MRTSLYDYCVEHNRPDLLQQWHPERNGPLTPKQVTYGSNKKVWWLCQRGHPWQAGVYARTSGASGCPYCAGKRPWPGENDLASQRPDLAAQWHPTKNNGVTPAEVPVGSHRAVWWVCEKGHEWRAMVKSRVGGTGCPVCANRALLPGVNDLASVHPELARQWHPTKNGSLTPGGLVAGSHKKVWWVCDKGHTWRAMVKSRVDGTGCPVCANRALLPGVNDLASTHPELALQWHPTKNGGLTPRDLVAGSRRKVWWVCDRGHEWQATALARAGGSDCPVCAGKKVVAGDNDLATYFPAIAAQWHPTKNGGLTPEQVPPSSNRKVWWLCPLGHEYRAAVGARTANSSGCPYCAGQKVLPGFNDLATVEPQAAAQWHPTLNGTLTPEMVTAGSHRKVWWQCQSGHTWKAVIYSRARPNARKAGCPVCAGKARPRPMERYRAAPLTQSQFAAKAAMEIQRQI